MGESSGWSTGRRWLEGLAITLIGAALLWVFQNRLGTAFAIAIPTVILLACLCWWGEHGFRFRRRAPGKGQDEPASATNPDSQRAALARDLSEASQEIYRWHADYEQRTWNSIRGPEFDRRAASEYRVRFEARVTALILRTRGQFKLTDGEAHQMMIAVKDLRTAALVAEALGVVALLISAAADRA